MKVGYTFTLQFGFGVSKDSGFFIDTSNPIDPSNPNLMSLQFSATIPGFSATGRLGPFDVTATDIVDPKTGIGSNFTGTLSLGMTGPSTPSDGQLSLADLDSGMGFGDVVQASLSASAHVALQLTAGIFSAGTTSFDLAAAMPRIGTEFHLDWQFDPQTDDFEGLAPSVSFDDVELYLGDFLQNILGSVLDEIDTITKPLQPIIDILDTPLPIISQLAGRDFTMLDLVALFADDDDIGYIQALADVISLAQDLGGLTSLGSLAIPVGSFDLGGVSDLRTLTSLDEAAPVDESMSFDDLSGAEAEAGGSAGSFLKSVSDVSGGGFDIPLLDHPSTIFNLLLGQNVPLVTYTMPDLDVGFGFSQYFPIFGPLGAELAGELGVKIHLAFGYDTEGIMEYATSRDPADLLDGFYVSDRANADGTGPVQPQVEFYGSISAAAELNLLIAQAGVGGGIFASVDFTLDDPNGDGKVRFSEIAENAKRGALDIFDVGGELDAYLFAFLRLKLGFVTIFDDTLTIADITLLSFQNDPNSPPPTGSQSGGILTLNTPPGNDRINVVPVLDSSNHPIPGSVYVEAYGRQDRYDNVTEITDSAGGSGSDTITIDSRVTIPVELWGGSGNNYLIAGAGPTTLYGGAGNDTLVGGSGPDALYGGAGNDILSAGTGPATLDGGAGNDQLTGGPGNDVLTGDDGDDTLIGGGGDDTMDGGAGNDILQGGPGNDSMEGGSGNDSLYGGTGNDSMDGGPGDDYLEGDDGNDTITGGTGDDYIDGGTGNDSIYGGSGDDTIYGQTGDDTITGGTGNDYIDGGDDNDSIYGGTGLDTIYGGAGNDWIDGGSGADTIYGGTGLDTIYGGGGDDLIFAEADATGSGPTTDAKLIVGGVSSSDPPDSGTENDTIYGSLGNDTITGGTGNNLIFGLDGNDSIVGLGGNDTIDAGAGDDTVFGGGGNDSILGNTGDDFLDGGAGNDTIDGGAGNDTLVGESGDDVLYGDDGNDVLWGGSMQFASSAVTFPPGYDPSAGGQDPNTVFDSGYTPPLITPEAAAGQSIDGSPTDGNDSLYGGAGDDSLFGGGGNDYIDAGAGNDYADGGAGNDYIYGGIGDDILRGGAGNDTVSGGPGIDQLFGDAGNDQLFGDAGTLGLEGNLVPSTGIILPQAATFTLDVNGGTPVNLSIPPSTSPSGYATLDSLISAINTALTAAYSPNPSPVVVAGWAPSPIQAETRSKAGSHSFWSTETTRGQS